jgi:hypothetical protein
VWQIFWYWFGNMQVFHFTVIHLSENSSRLMSQNLTSVENETNILYFFDSAVSTQTPILASWLSRCSITWAMPPALFCFSYFFGKGLMFLLRASLRPLSSYLCSYVAGHSSPWPASWSRWGFPNFYQTTILLIYITQVVEITGIYHHPWPFSLCFKEFFRIENYKMKQEGYILDQDSWLT